ncbi:hypothetical protein V6N12_067058 [Hibiscus sabdariffa]|uniref:Uncharacterized protein n=1 Tax=Hibiscus sabdariffa TaxID=183260 RepID=A0ABR2AM70_9ROSI
MPLLGEASLLYFDSGIDMLVGSDFNVVKSSVDRQGCSSSCESMAAFVEFCEKHFAQVQCAGDVDFEAKFSTLSKLSRDALEECRLIFLLNSSYKILAAYLQFSLILSLARGLSLGEMELGCLWFRHGLDEMHSLWVVFFVPQWWRVDCEMSTSLLEFLHQSIYGVFSCAAHQW